MKQYLIAHDLGTSGDKATLFTAEGEMIRSAVVSYDVDFSGDKRAEQNPLDWWNAFCKATGEILEGIHPEQVLAVSFSAQMQGCLPVDEQGNPLRNSIIWADHRAVKEAALLEERLGADRIYELTGHRVSPSYTIEKLMWLKKHEPDIYQKTYKVLQAKDYIIFRLTGKFVTDYSDGSGTQAMDLKKMEWSREILDAAEIDGDIFPELHNSTDIAGKVTAIASSACGLGEHTLVICGGGDGPCSAVGAGCVKDGELFTTFGTSAWIGGTSSVPFADEEKILFCFAHVIPGKYMPCGTMQAAGSAYSYVRSVICDGEDYDLLDERMKRSPAGAKGLIFLPYLLGERSPRWNSDTSGAYLGIHPEHKKDDYVRASMEGIAMNLELILKAYRRKMSVDTMILTGGGAKSPVNAGILADVMQVDFQVPDHVEEATSIGAAMIAGVGAGVFQSFDEVEKFLHIRQRYQADKEKENVYRFVKQRFELAYQGLLPFFKAHE